MRNFLPVATALVISAGSATAPVQAQVPLPLPRPAIERTVPFPVARATPSRNALARPEVPQASAPARSDLTPPDGEDESAPCTELLASGIAEVELAAAISGSSGPALCGDIAPVRITAIHLAGGGKVELRPAAVARCEMALEFARWIRDDVAPSVRAMNTGLKRVDIAASYHCRPRNNVAGARLSEHGLANAIDVSGLHLDNGQRIAIVNSSKPPEYVFAEMRISACKRFTTVLAPGADASHHDHIHVDLAKRRGGYRLCQWPHAEWLIP